MASQEENAQVEFSEDGNRFVVRIRGDWLLGSESPDASGVIDGMRDAVGSEVVCFEVHKETHYDSVLASYLFAVIDEAEGYGHTADLEGLPERLTRLLMIGQKVPEKEGVRKGTVVQTSLVEEVGNTSLKCWAEATELATFTGECVLALGHLFRGRAQLRWKDFWLILKSVSVDALPIVALISFLVGMIIAFLGAVTLKQFGAEFAVAYLVGYGILREMGAIMTGIIMAGRTGAAFAAQIGSMKVNEEIDALKTFGISPIEFIVLPRLLALFIMMPLLTLYANVVGILSGWIVAEGLMGVPGPVFFLEMNTVVGVGDFLLGIFKACVFGVLVATAGCLRGLQSGSGADAVGIAATRSVVAGITLIIFANAVIDWAAALLGV